VGLGLYGVALCALARVYCMTMRTLRSLSSPTVWLAAICLLFVLLALPGFRYPIVSDTIIYALTGESMWTHGQYVLLGQPYAKHMPLHGVLSYPLVSVLGYQIGMKLSALLAGCGVLVVTYALLKRCFRVGVALLSVALLAIHHGFLFTVVTAGSDPLFTMLFLLAVLLFAKAEHDERWYLGTGVALGLACLTRYNGAPLFPVFLLVVALQRRKHLRSAWFWGGMGVGAALFGLWFARNALTFGNPFATEYTGELAERSSGFLAQVWANTLFYANPLHNVLLLFPFALYGIVRQGRKQMLLLLSMLSAWALTSFWYVPGMRFAMAGYPILIGFGVWGLLDLLCSVPRLRTVLISLIFLVHIAALSLYAFGSVNAFFDRTLGWLPKDLGLSSEGFYSWDQARDFVNANAQTGATVHVDVLRAHAWNGQGIFRCDLHLRADTQGACPVYAIRRTVREGDEVLYRTPDAPQELVLLEPCP